MKWVRIVLLIVFAITITYFTVPLIQKVQVAQSNKMINVLVVYNNELLQKDSNVLDGYKSVLEEEGIPHTSIEVIDLINMKVDEIVNTVPAIIFPDSILQSAPSDLATWTKSYMEKGGNIIVVYDVGIKHSRGYFLKKALFSEIVGVNYIRFDELKDDAFAYGKVRFSSEENRDFFQIPYGKTIDGKTISNYGVGAVDFGVLLNTPIRNLPSTDIYAEAILGGTGEKIPAMVISNYGNGKYMYINFPLGQLKLTGDDLLLRASLRTFLFDVVNIPHIMNVAQGKGGVVVNWHVDSGYEHENLPQVFAQGYFDKDINASIHITAGDFLDEPDDGLGFKADTVGKPLVKMLMEKGLVGSHGGFAHNWFSDNIDKKFLVKKK